MNLISCDTCGIVIDRDKIPEPNTEGYGGQINLDNVIWNYPNHYPSFRCPLCNNKLYYSEKVVERD